MGLEAMTKIPRIKFPFHNHGWSKSNLALIGQVVKEKMMFENKKSYTCI